VRYSALSGCIERFLLLGCYHGIFGPKMGVNLMAKTIAELDQEIKQLQARKQKLATLEAAAERKRLERQKIILGGWLMSQRPDMVEHIKGALTRPQDRAAFGLP